MYITLGIFSLVGYTNMILNNARHAMKTLHVYECRHCLRSLVILN
jgi:hypothetical protein